METLDVFLTIFNPRGFHSRYRLYREFCERYGSLPNIRVHTIEVAFADRPFVVTRHNDPLHVQLRTKDEHWHKERSINLGVAQALRTFPEIKRIAWIDADISFLNHHWVDDAIRMLDHHKVVQLFADTGFLDAKGKMLWQCEGVIKKYLNHYHSAVHGPNSASFSPYPGNGGHPGLAWAMRRETFSELGGLLDFCIAGSGDSYMAQSLLGNFMACVKPGLSDAYVRAIGRWADRVDRFVSGSIGYVDGMTMHYWHGSADERGYDRRCQIEREHAFNPDVDLVQDEHGLYRLSHHRHQLARDIAFSLSQRNEDASH